MMSLNLSFLLLDQRLLVLVCLICYKFRIVYNVLFFLIVNFCLSQLLGLFLLLGINLTFAKILRRKLGSQVLQGQVVLWQLHKLLVLDFFNVTRCCFDLVQDLFNLLVCLRLLFLGQFLVFVIIICFSCFFFCNFFGCFFIDCFFSLRTAFLPCSDLIDCLT